VILHPQPDLGTVMTIMPYDHQMWAVIGIYPATRSSITWPATSSRTRAANSLRVHVTDLQTKATKNPLDAQLHIRKLALKFLRATNRPAPPAHLPTCDELDETNPFASIARSRGIPCDPF
jgi:hypothetical protein